MPLSITFIRHGRSEANEAGSWQGHGDAALSESGERQVAALGARMAGAEFDLVVSSDLQRARRTAEVLGTLVEVDPRWREIDIGRWEGRRFEDVNRERPGFWQEVQDGAELRFGDDGETIPELNHRVAEVLDELVKRAGESRVAVVTHGGVIDSVAGRVLGRIRGRATFPIVTNTSLTVLDTGGERITNRGLRLTRFNDAGHLGVPPGALESYAFGGVPVLALVRHGITDANLAGRIQGSSCWGMNEQGHSQARAVAQWYGPVDRVISSPLRRATETAAYFGVDIETDQDLSEMAFGDWEGKVVRDLLAAGDELAARIFGENQDLPRGGHGETLAQLMERTSRFLRGVELESGQRTIAVSHGAAIRAIVAGVIGRGSDMADVLSVPTNAAVSHVAFPPGGPMLVDYSVSPAFEAGAH